MAGGVAQEKLEDIEQSEFVHEGAGFLMRSTSGSKVAIASKKDSSWLARARFRRQIDLYVH